MVKRFKVWRVELMELDEGEDIKGDDDCEIVVLASDYNALAIDVLALDARIVELEEELEMERNDDRGVM